jgi:hypothetical protein
MKYRVQLYELWCCDYRVDAENLQEALEMVRRGEIEPDVDSGEYLAPDDSFGVYPSEIEDPELQKQLYALGYDEDAHRVWGVRDIEIAKTESEPK